MFIELEFMSGLWLLLAVPLLWLSRKNVATRVLVLRTMVFAFIILAVAQPVLLHDKALSQHVIIADLTTSIDAEHQQDVKRITRRLIQESLGKAIPSVIVVTDKPKPKHVNWSQWFGLSDDELVTITNASTITAALTKSNALIPYQAQGSVTLITDGLATQPKAWQPTVKAMAARDIHVNTLPVAMKYASPVITEVTALPTFAGEKIPLKITVEGQGQKLILSADATGGYTATQHIEQLDSHAEAMLYLSNHGAGFEHINVKLQKSDVVLSEQDTVAAVQPKAKITLIEPEGPSIKTNLSRVIGQWAEINTVLPQAITRASEWQQSDLLIMHNVAIDSLSRDAQNILTQAVSEKGIGLLFSGDNRAFHSDVSQVFPLVSALPVEFIPPQNQKEPSVALAIIIDSSGSMAGEPMSLAKKVARLAVRNLKPQDYVGIVEFYGNKQWAVPMQPLGDSDDLERAIGRMQASGGTVLFPALQEAYFGLKSAPTRYKHMLMITDAGVEEENYQQLLQYIARDKINVSTVLVGESASGSKKLQELANWGKGRFYQVDNNFSLIELSLRQQETKPDSVMQHGLFTISPRQLTSLGGGRTQVPKILAYAKTKAKPDADVRYFIDDHKAPLWAEWQWGMGKVAVMTHPLFSDSNLNWAQWQGYGDWLVAALQNLRLSHFPYGTKLERQNDEIVLMLNGKSSSKDIIPPPVVEQLDSHGNLVSSILVNQKAPQWFETTLSIDNEQSLQLALTASGQTRYLVSPAHSDRFEEVSVPSRLRMPLTQIAEHTGGISFDSMNDSTTSIGDQFRNNNLSVTPLMSWLVLLSLVLYLFELACRRVPHLLGKREA